MAHIQVSLVVNGVPRTHAVEPRTLLVQFLREHCALTGTHVGRNAAPRTTAALDTKKVRG